MLSSVLYDQAARIIAPIAIHNEIREILDTKHNSFLLEMPTKIFQTFHNLNWPNHQEYLPVYHE